MTSNFFPSPSLFWSFWAHILFIVGMIGYCLMDGLDYARPDAFTPFSTSIVYVLLAAIFVVNATFQVLSTYYIRIHNHRYVTTVLSNLFDEIGSHSYLFGAIFAALAFSDANTIWTLNLVGLVAFAVAAIVNLIVPGLTRLHSVADGLNVFGALVYIVAFFITNLTYAQIIVLIGDFVYLVDAVFYTICWFFERQWFLTNGEQLSIVNNK